MRSTITVTVALCLLASLAAAGSRPQLHVVGDGIHHGQPTATSKALGDTIYLIGNPGNPDHTSGGGIAPQVSGTFQDAQGNPHWNGWTSQDFTAPAVDPWQISDFMAVNGAYSYWCGREFDGDPGYGNDWNTAVVFTHQVNDNTAASTVAWSATVQNDTEPMYDFTVLEVNRGGEWQSLNGEGYDGLRTFDFDTTFTMDAADYVGDAADEIQLRIRFTSDGAYSDEDQLYGSNGACQVDDITVMVDGVTVDHEDFEDQTADRWPVYLFPGVGDYAQLFINLHDLDECRQNATAQAAFIDDGLVVPGTGGTQGQTWRYGPGGYIVNNTGGLAGPDHYIHNRIMSPALVWPAGSEGCSVQFEVYRHEELGSYSVWPGIFYLWHVSSINTGNPDDLEFATAQNRDFVQYGGPDYVTHNEVVTDLLMPGRTHMRVDLRVIEYGYIWGWVGTDGTPAPYFDNVIVRAYPFGGPAIAGRAIDWFQDDFPAHGDLDLVDLGSNSVRLDAAQNIAPPEDGLNVPADSCWFDATVVRSGAVMMEPPRFHVRMRANPLFDPHRLLPGGFTRIPGFFPDGWSLVEGWVFADSCYTDSTPPAVIQGRWSVDLPDSQFFYPGDVLKWYVSASDQVGADVGTSLLPADTTGFAGFGYNHDLLYHPDYVVRALPTMRSAVPGDQPEYLFWNDFVTRGADNEWRLALANLGLIIGRDFDMFATNGPSSGVGNGLGGRATSTQLSGYTTMLYSAGDLSVNLLANGDADNDPSDDLAVVTGWFEQGDKQAIFTGDNIVSGLQHAGAQGQAFVNTYFGVTLTNNSAYQLIDGQTAPTVTTIAGNSMISTVDRWIAYGGCPGINRFDAVECAGTAERLAEFTDPAGNAGFYPYAAAVANVHQPQDARVIVFPYDFATILNAPGWTPPQGHDAVPARAIILDEILTRWGHTWSSPPVAADTPAASLSAAAYPNPFNPRTTVALDLPRDGRVSVTIYNVRGQRVRTLIEDALAAGRHDVVWDGTTDRGRPVGSGVYFYEVRAGSDEVVGKLTMIK